MAGNPNRLPRLRARLTPMQATQRRKKMQRRRTQSEIMAGVRRDKWRRWKSD